MLNLLLFHERQSHAICLSFPLYPISKKKFDDTYVLVWKTKIDAYPNSHLQVP